MGDEKDIRPEGFTDLVVVVCVTDEKRPVRGDA